MALKDAPSFGVEGSLFGTHTHTYYVFFYRNKNKTIDLVQRAIRMYGCRGLELRLLRGILGVGVKAAEAVDNTAVAPLCELGKPG